MSFIVNFVTWSARLKLETRASMKPGLSYTILLLMSDMIQSLLFWRIMFSSLGVYSEISNL